MKPDGIEVPPSKRRKYTKNAEDDTTDIENLNRNHKTSGNGSKSKSDDDSKSPEASKQEGTVKSVSTNDDKQENDSISQTIAVDDDKIQEEDDTTNKSANNAKYVDFVNPEELEKLREFQVLDEVKSNDEDEDEEDSDSSDGIAEEEIEKMLDEELPEELKGAPKPKPKPYSTREKILLEEKGVSQFEMLPADWMMARHYSGMPIYMHRTTRVCTLSRPYFLGKGNTMRHDIPISAIPCLAYRRALEEEEKQKELDKLIEEEIKNVTKQLNENKDSNAAKCPFLHKMKAGPAKKDDKSVQMNYVCQNNAKTDFNVCKCPVNHESNDAKVNKTISKASATEKDAIDHSNENTKKTHGDDTNSSQEKDLEKKTDNKRCIQNDHFKQNENANEIFNVIKSNKKKSDNRQCNESDHVMENENTNQACNGIESNHALSNSVDEEENSHINHLDNPNEIDNAGNVQEGSKEIDSQGGNKEGLAKADLAKVKPVVLPGGIVMPPPRVEEVSDNWKNSHLTPEQVNDYCKRLFKFKTVNIMHFKRWADRRKYTKARKTLQYPALPQGTKLITIPHVGNGTASPSGKAIKRDWVMDMNGRSYLSMFHEYVRQALEKQPVYEFKQLENAATPYQATVYIGGMQYGVGHGPSKRAAKAAAARASIKVLIPEMATNVDPPKQDDNSEPDFSFFDYVAIEDPRIMEFCAATCEPSPHAILRTCLLRNFGATDRHIHTEMEKLEYQKIKLTMKVGKHEATVVCKNKKTAKQRASQAILQLLHPHVRSWGSLLRLYGSRSVKSCKEKKEEEQQITLLQDAARQNEPNYAVLEKLRNEMRKLRERDEAVVPIGTLLVKDDLPTHSGSNLNNVDL